MTSYLENLKWIIARQDETSNPSSKSPDKFEIIERHNSDADNEIQYNFDQEDNNLISQPQSDIQEINSEYNTIHLEMIKKEQLIRDILDSDTINKIKSNYTDYINDDVKIIKDFTIIMETFTDIQNKLNEFVSNIKELETYMRTKTLNQDANNLEFENKIKQIDIKLNNTIKFMEEIKLNNDVVMKKIIKLENTINSNNIKEQEILTIEKINIANDDDKKENKVINWYKQNTYLHILLYNDFSSILIYVLTGSCMVGTYFGIKYILRKN